jgi:enterochelin esterase-like enzyme
VKILIGPATRWYQPGKQGAGNRRYRGRVETIRWRNSDGGTIEGVLTFPVGYQQGSRYPLIVNPHGRAGANNGGSVAKRPLLVPINEHG